MCQHSEDLDSVEEGQVIMAKTDNSSRLYRFLGSFGNKSRSNDIVQGDEFYVKCVNLSGSNLKIGMIFNETKKAFLKQLMGDIPEPEEEDIEAPGVVIQTTVADITAPKEDGKVETEGKEVEKPEEKPEEKEVPADSTPIKGDGKVEGKAVLLLENLPAIYGEVHFEGGIIEAPELFFDELHLYGDFKHKFSHLFTIHPSCCGENAHYLIYDKRLRCSVCSKELPNTGWVKPKPSITF